MKKYWPAGLLALVLLLAFIGYWPGLNGSFLFDDQPNLETLGQLGGVHDWFTLKAYVLSGQSGPSGRPLSLLSFLLKSAQPKKRLESPRIVYLTALTASSSPAPNTIELIHNQQAMRARQPLPVHCHAAIWFFQPPCGKLISIKGAAIRHNPNVIDLEVSC